MRVVITRPRDSAERTANAVRALGHDVLVAPLMTLEPIIADLDGGWGAVVITSANAITAIAENAALSMLKKLPLFAVGRRSAEAARDAGFTDVASADGDVRDLVRLVAAHRAPANASILYLTGEDRAADLITELSAGGVPAELRVVYHTVAAPFSPALIAALKVGEVDAVLHFSRRSAENYVAGANAAGMAQAARAVRHFCLSAQVAEPLVGADRIAIAARPEEAALIALLGAPTA